LSEALATEFTAGLAAASLEHGEVKTYCTPRRLAVLVEACATAQPDRDVERRGPAIQAAFDEQGEPTKAALGFARSCGTEVADLDHLETDKGPGWYSASTNAAGPR
jgi:glycyl-tRNA synthetase beta chain